MVSATSKDDNDFESFGIRFSEPLLYQVWTKLDKDTYNKFIHTPVHCKGSAPLFGNFMEMFSKTPWWVVPLIWIPVSCAFLYTSVAVGGLSLSACFIRACLGVLIWSLLEYSLHRFLFHVDDNLPNNSTVLLLHFLLHGIHHLIPMDRLRLVFPPALAIFIMAPIWYLLLTVMSVTSAQAVFGGGLLGYICYDMTHYHIHHATPFGAHLRAMKSYHMKHHYKNKDLGFGISSKLWDYVFQTVLE